MILTHNSVTFVRQMNKIHFCVNPETIYIYTFAGKFMLKQKWKKSFIQIQIIVFMRQMRVA